MAWRCRYCDTAFDSFASKNSHQCSFLKNTIDSKHYTCRICFKEIAKSSFTCHSKIHIKASFECSVCNRTYTTNKILKQHMKKHDQKSQDHQKSKIIKVLSCDQCSETFSTPYRLKVHKKQVHDALILRGK